MKDERKFKIYCYTNIHNNKKYIGQTYRTLACRAGEGGKRYKNPELEDDDLNQFMFWKAIYKYGWESFIPSILEDNLTLQEANEREKYWIAYYHTWVDDPQCWGYNLQPGGENHTASEATKEKLREKFSGEKNPFYGKHHTEETKQKLRETFLGKPGHKHTEETKKKLSEDRMGAKHHNAKKVLCVETGIIYGSIREAARETGQKSPTGVNDCCHGLRHTAGGYHWKLIEEDSSC